MRILAAIFCIVTTLHAVAAPRVYRDKITPHWLGNAEKESRAFWYRVDLANGRREFVLVDAERGQRAPAFDHARVSEALSRRLGRSVDARALPFDGLVFADDRRSVILQGRDGDWKLDLASYEVSPVERTKREEKTLRPRRTPRPSKPGSMETSVRFVNKRAAEVDLFWLREDGGRQFYGSVAPGSEREQHTFSGHAWLVAEKSGEAIAVFAAEDEPGTATLTAPMEFEPPPPEPKSVGSTRSPDGKWEAIVRGHDLFLRNTADGMERQLTHDANADNSYARNAEALRAVEMDSEARDPAQPTPQVYWSPDSRHLVAMRHTRGSQRRVSIVESSPEDQLQPRVVSFPYLKPGDDVPYAKPHLFDVQSEREIAVSDAHFANPWSIDDVRWSADSREFKFLFNQRGHQALRILGVDAKTGAVRTIVEETSKTFVCYSSKFFVEYLEKTGELVWMSERDGWNHLYLYDAKTGRVKNPIAKGDWVVRGVERVDADKRQIVFRASGRNAGEDPYFVHYYRVNFDGSGLVPLTEGNGTHSAEFSPDRRFLVDTWSRVDQPPITELRSAADGRLLCRLEEADDSELAAAGWTAPEPFVAKGRDGATDIHGVIYRPKNLDPAKRHPVIEDIYAGPHDSFVPKSFSADYRFQRLLDRGFVIVRIDGMGTSNRSKAFHDVCWKNLADSGFPDRIAWIKAAAAKRPWMDLDRVGIFGTSAGGQSALRALLDHGDFYKAGVADSGCHDNRMDKIWWNEQWLGWPVDESYVRSSNVVDAHKLKGSLLLVVGEMDRNVDPASTAQVANALIKAGKDFEYLLMPGMGHGVLGTPYGAKRLESFFVRNLLDEKK
jgi:dipeptidyl aminopeptidase/acylaminoacyl peptidase